VKDSTSSTDSAVPAIDTVVLDIDGTLVDSVYQHTLAWTRAFQVVGIEVPSWRVHGVIGMGGDRLVAELAGPAVEDAVGDDVRAGHARELDRLWPSVHVLPGAGSLISDLKARGLKVAVATSGSASDAERALGLLEDAGRADAVLTGDDDLATKPAADLLEAAVTKVGGRSAAAVGDSVWDLRAAREAAMLPVGLLTGGIGEATLREAGARLVLDAPAELIARLDDAAMAPSD
jgi:phosphoglycolate phosphatase